MKKLYLLPALFLAFCQWSCTDKCEETRTYKTFRQITISQAELRQGIKTETSRILENPGKIYVKGNFLFINEIKKGLHVIDNSNTASPRIISFIAIPGNGDMAVKGNILYADNYTDLVALNISDPTNVKEVGRVENVFTSGQFDGASWWYNSQNSSISDQLIEVATQTVSVSCEDGGSNWGNVWRGGVNFSTSTSISASAPTTTGQAGSMARFALYDNYLYTVSQSSLQLFDIKSLEKPIKGKTINMGWGIETIFPYKDKLFIGSTTGMFIYDNKNPEAPTQLSVFQHAMSCDPVVVNDNRAYVTLRSGTTCNRGLNQLDIIDITNLRNPTLIKSYPMQNPHGLGIDFPNVFLCEGKQGLKSLDVQSDFDVKQLQHLTGMDAYDVILLKNNVLLMIGKDGLYQYDYSNAGQLKRLSTIPVNRPNV